jgi:hypothetical protein
MIKNTLVTGGVTTPTLVYTSSTTGAAIAPPGVTGQTNAITCIALCNIGAVTLTNEATNSVTVNIYVAPAGIGYQASGATCNLIVSSLTVPAGETVFFSDERIVLDAGDEIYIGASTSNLICATVSSLPV